MRTATLVNRSLWFYRRTNAAMAAGVAIAVAVLAGALLVGESVRSSLREIALQRLGAVDLVVSADRLFREQLAADLARRAAPGSVVPILYLQGTAIHGLAAERAYNVQVFGVDQRFWRFHGVTGVEGPEGRDAFLSPDLAEELAITPGQPLILQLAKQDDVPAESLYSRKEDPTTALRLECRRVVERAQLGSFSLQPGQGPVRSVFVSLGRLQQELRAGSRANAILVSARGGLSDTTAVRRDLSAEVALEDFGIRTRTAPGSAALVVESSRIVLDDGVVAAVEAAASSIGASASGVLTWLATAIRVGDREIPYSAISAVDVGAFARAGARVVAGSPLEEGAAEGDGIWLNEWAWRELDPHPGSRVEVEYYVWLEQGRIETRLAHFELRGALAIEGPVGPGLAPEYPGIARARSLHDWDPPFPLDLRKVRPRDEAYWAKYRTTPKAFVPLDRGRELWQSRFGSLTSVQFTPPPGTTPEEAETRFAAALRSRLDPEDNGFRIKAVRGDALEASRGSTDFGEYFVYFSFFLIVAAILLAALFFRLGVEQRLPGVGVMSAAGFGPRKIRNLLLAEGLAVALAGSVAGAAAAVGYARLLVAGLGSWWVGAVGTREITLHLSAMPLAAGAAGGLAVAFVTIAMMSRGAGRIPVRALLSGAVEPARAGRRAHRRMAITAATTSAAGLVALAATLSGWIQQVAGFFVAGLLLMAAALAAAGRHLRRPGGTAVRGRGILALFRLGARGTRFRPGRSLLSASLIAVSLFVVVSMETFRQGENDTDPGPSSGTGGFRLLAESVVPIVSDLNDPAVRGSFGVGESAADSPAGARFVPFRLRPGDDTSCLNLYAPREPRILGASHAFVEMARFSFGKSLATAEEGRRNPWRLLEADSAEGSVPAIADANTIQYILHSAVGEEITIRDGGGRPVRLRFVAALRGSIFQGELLIGERAFLRLFPQQQGYRYFLIDVPEGRAASLGPLLEDRLSPFGFDVRQTRQLLAAFHQVENTYLSTFQMLGTLGLVLGTAGLATVLLRNVLERRGELALLRAVGYRGTDLAMIVVSENLVLMLLGMACGTAPALLAVVPAILSRGAAFPFAGVAGILAAVLVTGLLASGLAVSAALRSPLLPSLRGE